MKYFQLNKAARARLVIGPSMTTIRSSVTPASSKQKWGTILKPNFGMGYQKMNSYEIDQTVERLAQPVEKKEREVDRPQQRDLKQNEIDDMVCDVTLPLLCS